MIIQLISDSYKRGYLPKFMRNSVAPFFGGLNLAVRREVFAEVGEFDPSLRTGEDIDFCIRTLQSRWELYFEPAAKVAHHNRDTLAGLAKQWFDYGRYHARLFKKHNPPAVEILLLNPERQAYARYAPIFYREGARALIFVTSFSAMHAALGAAWLTSATPPLSAMFAATALLCAYRYFEQDFKGDAPLAEKLSNAGLRYVVNAALVSGGLVGGFENRYLYVYGTLWQKV